MTAISLGLPNRLPNRNRGLCADLPQEQKDWFFAEGEKGIPLIKRAKKICNSGCPMKQECLDIALRKEVSGLRFGVFGGLSARERDRNYPSWYRMAGLCNSGLHPMAGDNLLHRSGGSAPRCRACKLANDAIRRSARKAEADLAAAV